jgi:molybdopterin-guanine dinucleotide biosynthesis protein A
MDSGNLRIVDFFPRVKVRTIEPEELTKFDPEEISFFNINTQEDLAKARGITLP